MKINEILSPGRRFISEGDLKIFLKETHPNSDEKFLESETLLVFWSTNQRTWLAATDGAMYCVFDLLKEPGPRVKWHIPRSDLVSADGKISVLIKTEYFSSLSDWVVVDGKKPRKFSKKLFERMPIDQSIRIMLMKAFSVLI